MKSPLLVPFLVFLNISSLFAQQYAVNTYVEPRTSDCLKVKTIFIDLESKQIVKSVVLAENGYLLNKKPLNITANNRPLLISAVLQGCVCKNAAYGPGQTVIAEVDFATGELVHVLTERNLDLVFFMQHDDSLLFLDGQTRGDEKTAIHGVYGLDSNYNLILIKSLPQSYNPDIIRDSISNRFYDVLDSRNDLYMSWTEERRVILKKNKDIGIFSDSLEINNNPYRSIICATLDTLLYIFHQNYEYYGKFTQKTRKDDWIQSHLLVYNISDFSLLDSLTIPDYPEGDYIIAEFDKADIEGDYIVHYFALPGGLEDYTPAMLFIFDTRINEASWLRVGWR